MSRRKPTRAEHFKILQRERLRRIKLGKEKPKNAKEWAIYWDALGKRNQEQLRSLKENAAINKPSTMAGKIIVVPPKVV